MKGLSRKAIAVSSFIVELRSSKKEDPYTSALRKKLNPHVVTNPPQGPPDGAKEGLWWYLKEVAWEVSVPLPDFTLGGVCDNRSRVH
jgi:hypothetical protein